MCNWNNDKCVPQALDTNSQFEMENGKKELHDPCMVFLLPFKSKGHTLSIGKLFTIIIPLTLSSLSSWTLSNEPQIHFHRHDPLYRFFSRKQVGRVST